MTEQDTGFRLPSPVVALAGWLMPGAGYWLIGQRARGTVVCVTIIVLYLLGLLIAGARVIDVPGYDRSGNEVRLIEGRLASPNDTRSYPVAGWALTSGGFVSEITSKPWFVGQVLIGPICLASAAISVDLAQRGPDYPRPHAPLDNVGTLYTAIAGMLNLMVIIDAAYRAGLPREAE